MILRPTSVINDPYGFPSGHSSFMFYLVPFAFKIDKKIGFLYLILSIIVAYSRIYLKEHTLIDVFFGGLLGYLLGYFIIKNYE